MGNLLSVDIHAANIHDTTSGIAAAYEAFEKYPTIEAFCGDEGYRGTFIDDVDYYIGVPVNISERIAPKFVVQPKRWVVERTFAWLGNSRRLSKDYEIRTDSAAAMVKISHIHTLLRRLC